MKRFLLITILLLSTTLYSLAQSRSIPGGTDQILRFYPNPATSIITFDFKRSFTRGYSLEIYNFLGRKMFEQNNINDRLTINLSEFQRGVYVYQLHDNTGRIVEAGKFQVSK